MSLVSGPTIVGKRAFSASMTARVSSTLSVVWVMKASLSGSATSSRGDLLGGRDQMHAAVDPPHRAVDLGMAGMADQDDLAALIGVALALDMDLGDERAGRVDHRQPALGGPLLDRAGDAVGAEDRDAARRDLVDLVDEMRSFGAQPLDDVAVVDDFVADIDRRAIFLERALDDLDRPFDPGAKSARLG